MEKIENGIDDVIGRYTYNADGIRYSKTAGGVTTKFYYNGTTLTGEDRGDKKLRYCYDQEGICGFRYYNGSEWKAYTYVKNLQGDIILIKDGLGAPKVKYEYDPWGNVTYIALNLDGGEANPDEDELAKINPFRYRGYYYDEESKLYYLITRYYDPWVGQFISPDSFEYLDPGTIGGINLYAYCNYNPIMYVDPTGHSWESFWNNIGIWFEEHWGEVAIGTAFILGGAIVSALTCGTGTTAWAAFGSALLSSAIQVGASVTVGVGVNGLVNIVNGNPFFDNVGDIIASSYMWGGIFSGGSQMLSGGFRVLRAKTGFKGLNGKNLGLLSPDKLYYDRAGMTIIRLGSRNGIKLALDLGRYGIHMHLISNLHIPMIPILVGLIEIFN